MSFSRICEIVIYSILNVIPYKILLLQPFWHKRRFGMPMTIVCIAAVYIVETLRFAATAMGLISDEVSFVLHGVIGLLFCIVAIKDRLGKSFLTFLILMSFSTFIITVSKFFEHIVFPEYAVELYHWTHIIFMIPVEAIALGIDTYYSIHIYTKALESAPDSYLWKFLWIVPMISVLIWYAVLFLTPGGYSVTAKSLRVNIWMAVITGGFWFMDYIIARFAIEQKNRAELERQSNFYIQQQWQFQNMNKRIEDARRARHDIRHHLQIAMRYLNENKIDELREYIAQYEKYVPNESLQTFCNNYAANTILTYYQQRCLEREIEYNVAVALPEDAPFPEHDIVVILGNLIENAADAALEEQSHGKKSVVSILGTFDGSMFMLQVENTVWHQPVMDKNGRFQSTKHEGYGIGVASVRRLAEDSGGTMTIRQPGDKFIVEVVVYKR